MCRTVFRSDYDLGRGKIAALRAGQRESLVDHSGGSLENRYGFGHGAPG
jgi:hypothetical protein